ncbi:MAG: hypothetical protein KZQ58_05950, partial [gamma proteobacterium symbiont of Bathyaustriella thionipta]|nr:hypothetical protein [gamma proteobacterium symbiont of Bathyaustriella thionipta]
MFHHIKRAVLLAWLGGIFLLILLALLISVTRILLPRLSAYRVELEQTASQYVGGQVHIQSMSVGLRGFHPEIVLQKVAIEPPFGKADFFLGEVRIGLDSKALLLQQQVHPLYMEFKQSRIRVKHRSDGSVVIDGLEEIGTHLETADHQSQPNWVVRISDSTLIWENQVINAAPVRANVEQLDLVIKGQHAQINADLQLAKQGGRIHLAADVQGRLGWANEWDARFFMQARNVQLKKFLAGRTGGTFNFADGESDFRLWSHWKSGKLQDISGELSLHSLLLENGRGDNLRQYQLEKMSSWLRWQRTLEGWRFDADELQIQHKGITEPASTISMVASYDEQGKLDVSGGLSRLRPHNLLEIFAVVPLPQEKWAQTLQAVKPQADISNMAFRVHMLEPRAQWYARADLKELALQDFENIPRIKGLSGHIVADQDKGLLSLNSHGLSLFPPRLFRQPLEAEQAQGEIRWWRDEQMAWQLDAAHIDLQTADIKTSSRFSLRLPQHADEAFFLDLQTAFGEGDATRVPDYLPVGIMSANVVDWLDQAFVKGRVLHGGVIVRGDLRKFPFSDSDGRFQVLLDVDDMNILYQPGWPLIKQVAAEIQFDAARLDVWVKQGQQYSSRIKQAHIWIDDMFEETPLRLKAQSQGPTQDVLRFLSESPLKSTFAYLTEGVQAEGRNASELELTVPLSGEAATVRGNTRFQYVLPANASWRIESG